MKRTFIFSLLLILIVGNLMFISPTYVNADGIVIYRPDPYSEKWDYLSENNQQVFINYEKGIQKMIISIDIKGSTNSSVWIFPIPSDSNKTSLNILKQLPYVEGQEITKEAKNVLHNISGVLKITQIYSAYAGIRDILGYGYVGNYGDGLVLPNSLGNGGGYSESQSDVIVYRHLEKEGTVAEIITAKNSNSLYEYLKNKGLNISPGSISILDRYMGKDYSFIVSWINPTSSSSIKKGLLVSFPTKNIYFPLVPTSVYGDKIIPVTIRIIGYVSPKLFESIKGYTTTEYYQGKIIMSFDSNDENLRSFYDWNLKSYYKENLSSFYPENTGGIKYTKIEIKAPSKYLTDDLLITKRTPLKVNMAMFITNNPIMAGVILLGLISLMSGICIGWFLFKDLRENPKKLILIILSNILTLIGSLFIVIFTTTKKKNENATYLLNTLKSKGYIWKRRLLVVILILLVLFTLSCLFARVITAGETVGYSFWTWNFKMFMDIYGSPYIKDVINSLSRISFTEIAHLYSIFAIFCLLWRIRPEDKDLFIQLRNMGYSSWLFIPKDKNKIIFIALYSVGFLVFEEMVIKLIMAYLS